MNFINVINRLQPANVLEIGFNGGFSALLMKMTKPDIKLTCIDINQHPYVVPCYEQISRDISGIDLILDSSVTALPKLIELDIKFDVIHIDGDHSKEGAQGDMELCLKLSRKGTVIIFDDTDIQYINDICNHYVDNHLVTEYPFDKVTGQIYDHRFLEVI
jgi:predicted O-methyltransferase YrrM